MECKLIEHNGVMQLEINSEIIYPLSFKSFRPTDRNISDFYKAGVRLFSILSSGMNNSLGTPYSLYGESWVGENEYDFAPIDTQIELFIKNAPDAYFALMVQLDTRQWWLTQNKEYPNSFWCLSQIAADERWRLAAAKYLKAVLQHVEEKYGERFYGYFMLCGTTTEWFSDRDYEEPHAFEEKAYKEYLKDENAVIPPKIEREKDAGIVF